MIMSDVFKVWIIWKIEPIPRPIVCDWLACWWHGKDKAATVVGPRVHKLLWLMLLLLLVVKKEAMTDFKHCSFLLRPQLLPWVREFVWLQACYERQQAGWHAGWWERRCWRAWQQRCWYNKSIVGDPVLLHEKMSTMLIRLQLWSSLFEKMMTMTGMIMLASDSTAGNPALLYQKMKTMLTILMRVQFYHMKIWQRWQCWVFGILEFLVI